MQNVLNFLAEVTPATAPQERQDPDRQNTEGLLLNHLWETAYRSKYWQSFSPGRRANQLVRDYSQVLTEDLATLAAAAQKFNQSAEVIEAVKARYSAKFERLLRAWWNSESNCASSAITGPAKFPVRRQEKLRGWAENKYSEFAEWCTRAKAAIIKSFKPKATVETELQRYEKELADMKTLQERMKTANVILRKAKGADCTKELTEAGFSENIARKIQTKDHVGRVGFPSYSLTNNLANIKRVEERLAIMQKKQSNIEKGETPEIEFEGGTLVINHEADRIQILFPGKPAADVIATLKSNGFKWAPSQSAWQRQLTPNAKWAAARVTGIPLEKLR